MESNNHYSVEEALAVINTTVSELMTTDVSVFTPTEIDTYISAMAQFRDVIRSLKIAAAQRRAKSIEAFWEDW